MVMHYILSTSFLIIAVHHFNNDSMKGNNKLLQYGILLCDMED